ncbi:hypothetical protein AgCh_016940 [Apium graveolens]
MQGEILEGLVARIVSHESSTRMEKLLKRSSPHQPEGVGLNLGPSLREIFAANRSDEKQQIKVLLQNVGTSFCPNFADWFGNGGTDAHSTDADESFLSKFLQANPSDLSTDKFQDIICSMREKRIPAAFKCYYNFHKAESMSSDNLHFKMVIHVRNDSAFQRYQKQMRLGFFVDVNLFNSSKKRASQITINSVDIIENVSNSNDIPVEGALADEDANLMIKMKFLTYKTSAPISTIIFPAVNLLKEVRLMKRWNTSEAKQRELSQMLNEWACYARSKHGHKTVTRPMYLTEVEPFLEEYAKRSRQNQALIGSAGNLGADSGKDEEEEVETEKQLALSGSNSSVVKDSVGEDEGLIVFFPGTDTNPYSLDALAVFIYRVLLRANHPGSLNKVCPSAGFVLLKFYHFYNGQDRKEFETELVECFGSLVKMPLLEPDRSPLPESVTSVLEEGINLFKLHSTQHGRLDSSKGTYAQQWAIWEKKLRYIIFKNAEYLKSIQVPFDSALKQVLKQLGTIAKGDYTRPRLSTEKRMSRGIIFAAVDIPVTELQGLLCTLAKKNSKVSAFLKDKKVERTLKQAHLTLAHKQNHGVAAVVNYISVLHQKVPVDMTALYFSDRLAALEAHPGSVNGEDVNSKNAWPHITLWKGEGVAAKESIALPQLFFEGKAARIKIDPPVTVVGTIKFR